MDYLKIFMLMQSSLGFTLGHTDWGFHSYLNYNKSLYVLVFIPHAST